MVVERIVNLMILLIDIHFIIIIDISYLHSTIAKPIQIITYYSKEKMIVINTSRALQCQLYLIDSTVSEIITSRRYA